MMSFGFVINTDDCNRLSNNINNKGSLVAAGVFGVGSSGTIRRQSYILLF